MHVIVLKGRLPGPKLAGHLARRLEVEVVVEQVVERDVQTAGPLYWPIGPEEAGRLNDQVVDRLRAQGVSARDEVSISLVGHKGRTVLTAAEESEADLILMESGRYSALAVLFGLSPLHRVLRSRRVPVLVLPSGPPPVLRRRLSQLAAALSWRRRRSGAEPVELDLTRQGAP